MIDTVFSIGVTYSSTRNTVVRFNERQGWALGPVEDRHRGEKTLGDLPICCAGLTGGAGSTLVDVVLQLAADVPPPSCS